MYLAPSLQRQFSTKYDRFLPDGVFAKEAHVSILAIALLFVFIVLGKFETHVSQVTPHVLSF